MSNHPYGLRGDPFATQATLSAKDASRLIRRRVRAFDGDGGALYPIDTCDLIHDLAGGIPDAMLELAGSALRIAAAEGAPAVSPAHVRKAAETAPATASVAKAPAALGVARAARAIDALIEVAEKVVRESTVGTANTDAAAEAELAAAAPAEADDLPPFHPAVFALPIQPSENLDQDARDWVSRFIPASGAGSFAGAASRVACTPTVHEVTAAGAPGRPPAPAAPAPTPAPSAAATERAPAVVYHGGAPGRRSRRRGPRRHRRSGSHGLLITVAAVCVIAFVVRMSMRGSLVPPGTEPARPVLTSAPTIESRTFVPESPPAAPAPDITVPAPAGAPTRVAPVFQDPAPAVHPPAPKGSAPEPASVSGTVPTLVEPARREAPATKFGLEVATFIFEERARVERDRLATTGLRARVVTTLEYGSRVYRVVIGGYPHPAAAERAADSLLSNGVVLQARVVRATSGR